MTFQRGAVSLPQGDAGRVVIQHLLPADLRATLEGGEGLLRSEREAAAAIASFDGCLATDGKLRRKPRERAFFLEELLDKGIIEGCDQYVEEVGTFFVPKTDPSQLRLIFDTRRANLWLHSPPSTGLPSGECLSDMEVPAPGMVSGASADVKVCFYQYAMPELLRGLFGVEGV